MKLIMKTAIFTLVSVGTLATFADRQERLYRSDVSDVRYQVRIESLSNNKLGTETFSKFMQMSALCGYGSVETSISYLSASIPFLSVVNYAAAVEVDRSLRSPNDRLITSQEQRALAQLDHPRMDRNLTLGGALTAIGDTAQGVTAWFQNSRLTVNSKEFSLQMANVDWSDIYRDTWQVYVGSQATTRDNLGANSGCDRSSREFFIAARESNRRHEARKANAVID